MLKKSVLVTFAHPDDEGLCGGAIALLTQEGHDVYFLCQTKGNRGTYDPNLDPQALAAVRAQELRDAARTLGVKDVAMLDYDDGDLQPTLALRGEIMRAIRRWKTTVVYTLDPWLPYEAHPDHRHAGLMAAEAAIFAGFPHFYPEQRQEGLQPQVVRHLYFFATAQPDTYVDIGPVMDKKVQAALCHRSQLTQGAVELDARILQGWEERIRTWGENAARKWGREGVRYAEGLKHFHVGPGHLMETLRTIL